MGLGRPIALYALPGDSGPMTTGCLRGRILVPQEVFTRLDREQMSALLAHEVAHLARRDPLWTLLGQVICDLFFFQPLNRCTRQQLRVEAEYLADRQAVGVLTDRLGLARCLATLGEWSLARAPGVIAHPPPAVGVSPYHSILALRIERILERLEPKGGRHPCAGRL